MKLYHKVLYSQRKVGVDFEGLDLNQVDIYSTTRYKLNEKFDSCSTSHYGNFRDTALPGHHLVSPTVGYQWRNIFENTIQ